MRLVVPVVADAQTPGAMLAVRAAPECQPGDLLRWVPDADAADGTTGEGEGSEPGGG